MLDETMTNVLNFKEVKVMPEQASILLKHARTMCLMYEATGDDKYLSRARLDMMRAKSIIECGFIRPLGVLLAA